MADLPESILKEVLLRLPFVALHRFKVVCKKWLSLASTPYFLSEYESYASRASISPPRWAFLSGKAYDCSERHDDPFEAHELLIDLHSGDLKCPNDESSYRIKGVSNGLVLYEWWSDGPRKEDEHGTNRPVSTWAVCNPVTRQRVVLPPGISEHNWRDVCGFLSRIEGGVVTSFTVVKYTFHQSEFEVFSSETGEWKLSRAYSPDSEQFFLHRTPTDFGGILHWIISCSYTSGIVAFDPSRNNCRVIPIPAPDGPCRQMGICGTHEGHLRYVEFAGQSLRVWVLNDYGRGDNWLLQHRSSVDILQDVHLECEKWEIWRELKLISFHPFNPDVVYLGCESVFLSYNLREGKWQVVKTCHALCDEIYLGFKWSRAFCLVIPPLPPLIPFAFSPKGMNLTS